MASPGRNRPEWIRYSGVGVELASAVAGFAAVGCWIDRSYDSPPWGVVVGAVLGMIGGMYNLIRTSLKAFKDQNQSSELKKQQDDEHDQHD